MARKPTSIARPVDGDHNQPEWYGRGWEQFTEKTTPSGRQWSRQPGPFAHRERSPNQFVIA